MSKDTRKKFNKSFERVLKELNPSQKEAVSKIEGPVLVIAGPGTGKTHILSARIGNILLKTDSQPHNILCLTFTDAGVLAMRERLQEFIGPEAHKVHIYTFHSFCNTIIQENLELFGTYDMEPISDLERVEVIREIIENEKEKNVLKKGRWDQFYFENHLKSLFKQMKAENWTVEFIENKIDEYLKSLLLNEKYYYKRNTKVAKKGDVKQKEIDTITDRMEKLRAAAKLFPIYTAKMRERSRYDYEDMILWVLEEFKNNESLLRRYQEQYLYFLVDEYQDTNGSQNLILHSLIDYWKKPNVFVVGDDDQSIFEFQGARLRNIIDFYQAHTPEIELIMLKDNYRSSQHILDASKNIIDNNKERIIEKLEGLDKNLIAKNNDFGLSSIKPQVYKYPNKMHEDIYIANHIEKLYKEGFPLEEIAVIYAKHKQARNIISLLERKGIPYNTKRRVNILDVVLMENIRTFIEYIYLEYKTPNSGEELLFKILHFNFIGINPSDLSRLSTFMAKYSRPRNLTWRDILEDEDEIKKIKFKNPSAIIRFSKILNELLEDIANYRCLKFIERLINKSGLLHYVLNSKEKAWSLQIISTFFSFVRRETDKNPRLTVKKLLDTLKNMDDNKLSIGVNKTVSAENGVNLLTAHGSKGLEFQIVFLIDCSKEWDSSSGGNRYRFSLPDTITNSNEETDIIESRRRLFYVGMTRAKEQLFITFSENENSGKKIEKSQFIDELIEKDNLLIKIEEKQLSEEEVILNQGLLLSELETPEINPGDRAAITELLEGFVLSVSSMNRFQSCRLSFYYEYVLKIPSIENEAATYGTAMHNALKRFFDKMLVHENKEFPFVEDLILYFEIEMKKKKHYFSKNGFTRRMNMGRNNLKLYYKNKISVWDKNVVPEMDIRNVEYKGVPLKGTLDKVVFKGTDGVHVVDYKTGSLDDNKMKQPTPRKPLGGIYWRQLYFYKILFENYRGNNKKVVSGEIAYLETDRNKKFPSKFLSYEEIDVEMVGDMMEDSYRAIKAHDFYEGCGEDNCKWCSFVKKNVMAESFSDDDAGDLDD